MIQDSTEIFVAQIFGNIQTERSQFNRNVGVDISLLNQIQGLDILLGSRVCLLSIGYILTKEIERYLHTALVKRLRCGNRILKRFTSYKSTCCTTCDSIMCNKLFHTRVLSKI